jgi:glycosyltransferase involved in cell wall biosynthesis
MSDANVPQSRRVLHLIESWGPGGAERVLTDIVAELRADRWRSVVVAVAEGWVAEQARAHGATVLVVPQRRRFDLGYLASLRRIIVRERIDIVHAHLLMSSLYGGMAAALQGLPAVATFHGSVDVPKHSFVVGLKARILQRAIDRTIFVSDALRQDIEPRLGLPSNRIGVVHNGVDTVRFAPGRSRHLREQFNIRDDEFVIGAVGNIRTSKAYDVLLRAVAALRDRGTPVRCLIAGNAGWDETQETVDALMRDLHLEGTVHFCGFVEDSAAFLRGVDMFVLTSRTEGFSIATLEAMATGLPVVATRCGGPEEIVTDGVDGSLVPVGSPAAVADALLDYINDPARREQAGRRARQTVTDRFSVERVASAYERIYCELLDPKPG